MAKQDAVKLTAVDAARLAMKDTLKGKRMVDAVNASGKTVSQDANDPATWVELGAYAGAKEGEHDKRTTALAEERKAALNIARILLKDAAAPVWNAFNQCFIQGAENVGYTAPANLLHRWITAPLAEEKITKPVSATSSNARVDASGKTVAERNKALAEALAKMTDAEIDAEQKSGKSTRAAELLIEQARRVKVANKAAEKAVNEQKSAAKKSVTDAMALMSPGEIVVLFGFANAILATGKNSMALISHCEKLLAEYDKATKKKGSKTKH